MYDPTDPMTNDATERPRNQYSIYMLMYPQDPTMSTERKAANHEHRIDPLSGMTLLDNIA